MVKNTLLEQCMALWASLAELLPDMLCIPGENWLDAHVYTKQYSLNSYPRIVWLLDNMNIEFFNKCVLPRLVACGLCLDCFVCKDVPGSAWITIAVTPLGGNKDYKKEYTERLCNVLKFSLLDRYCDNWVPF